MNSYSDSRPLNLQPDPEPGMPDSLKRLPPYAADAARIFRQTGHARYLPPVVRGILERFVSTEDQPKLNGRHESLRLAEDLGIDSLALMELSLTIEDALEIRLEPNELKRIATVRDLERALSRRRFADRDAPPGA